MKQTSVIEKLPRTLMEVFKILPEGTLAELINNQIYMSPSPLSVHQIVLNEINVRLFHFIETTNTGMVYVSPLDVYLDEISNAVQPDIIVLLKDNLSLVKEDGYIHGVPDMLIEVLSKGNKDHDLIRKKDLYERFGVKEYWVVDPDTKLALGFSLANKLFHLIAEDIGMIKSPLLNTSFTF